MKFEFNNLTMLDLTKILDKFSDVTGRLGYAIAKAKSIMRTELQPFEEQRNKLVQKYGSDDGNGVFSIKPGDENYTDFVNELISIGEIVSTIEVMQVSEDIFAKTDIYNDNASAKDYEIIEMLFVEKTATKE